MNIFNPDFKDFIVSLNNNKVQYILVGGYAVIFRGYSRSTGDMDIWVNKTQPNFKSSFTTFLSSAVQTEIFCNFKVQ